MGVSPFFFCAAISACRKVYREKKSATSESVGHLHWLVKEQHGEISRALLPLLTPHLSSPSAEAFLWLAAPANEAHWPAALPAGGQGYSRQWCPEALWEDQDKTQSQAKIAGLNTHLEFPSYVNSESYQDKLNKGMMSRMSLFTHAVNIRKLSVCNRLAHIKNSSVEPKRSTSSNTSEHETCWRKLCVCVCGSLTLGAPQISWSSYE